MRQLRRLIEPSPRRPPCVLQPESPSLMSAPHSEKHKAALASIGASAFITLAKLLAGVLSGSLALISEAAHAALDTGATILTYFAVRAADKPADAEHPYGHHKIESVAALIETGLLFVLAVGVLTEAVRRFLGHAAEAVDANALAFGVLVISIIIDVVRWRTLTRVAKETSSQALAADALHFSSDLVASVLVLIGLIATRFGFVQGDTLAAIGVAVFIAIAGWRLGQRTIETLIDAAPAGVAERLQRLVESVDGVVGVTALRVRPAGPSLIGDVEIDVARSTPLERVVLLKQEVARAIAKEAPVNDIRIIASPRAHDDETMLERVLLIAARRRVPVHHVTIQDLEGHKSVSLDVELDAEMSLGLAHEIASGLEAAIRSEIDGLEVETHIEPMDIAEREGLNAPIAVRDAILASLVACATRSEFVRDPHDLRVRETAAGLVVNYHCRIDPAMTVVAAHRAVDELDRQLQSAYPQITRIVGHAEPLVR